MASRVLAVCSDHPSAGKTHFAAGLARHLTARGLSVAPLHLSSPAGDPVDCPGGGSISRPAAILAEACGLMPALEFEAGWSAIPSLLLHHDLVVVEAPRAPTLPPGSLPIHLSLSPAGIQFQSGGSLPLFSPSLLPPPDPDLAALPPFRVGAGPRVAVVSLPHITNFPEYRHFRAAEWLALPAAGRFAVIFLPNSSNPAADLDWLQVTGLLDFLHRQALDGARLVASSWPTHSLPPLAAQLNPGDLDNPRISSLLLQVRIPAPLPSEHQLDLLAAWVAQWPGLASLTNSLF